MLPHTCQSCHNIRALASQTGFCHVRLCPASPAFREILSLPLSQCVKVQLVLQHLMVRARKTSEFTSFVHLQDNQTLSPSLSCQSGQGNMHAWFQLHTSDRRSIWTHFCLHAASFINGRHQKIAHSCQLSVSFFTNVPSTTWFCNPDGAGVKFDYLGWQPRENHTLYLCTCSEHLTGDGF